MSVTKFFTIFSGCQSAHGQTKVLDSAKNGKMNAKSFIVREPLTEELLVVQISISKLVTLCPYL